MDFWKRLFTTDFMPHGHCFFWRPEVLWLHVISDAIITLAYFAIPLALIYLVYKRQDIKHDLRFDAVFYMFGAFILLCGFTHGINILAIWKPVYRFEGVMKAITALVSVGTFVALLKLIPKALAIPSLRELEEKNQELEAEIEGRKKAEAALRESQSRFRGAFDYSNTGIAIVGLDGKWLEVNSELCKILGHPEEDLLAQTFQDITHPEDLDADMELLRQTMAGERDGYQVEKRYFHKQGQEICARLAVALVRNEKQEPLYFVSQIEDITERKAAQKALHESQQRFAAIFHQTYQFIGFLDPEGTLLEANETALKFGGIKREDVVGRRFWDCPWWQGSEAMQDRLRDAIRRSAQGELVRFQAEHPKPDGGVAFVDFSIKPMRDQSGKVKYLIPEGRDITDLREAQAESERQREVLRAVLENLAEGVVACDAEGQLMMFNKAAREWHGTDILRVPREQWPSRFDLFEGDGQTPLQPENIPLVRAFQGERVRNKEMAIVAKGHAPRFVLASGDAIHTDDGELLGAVVVMHDVTERRRQEEELEGLVQERTRELRKATAEAERANRAKSEFLSRMSHELRTPLNSILGFGQLLEMAQLSDRQMENVQRILRAGHHLLDLINEVLDISRVESGKLSVSVEPIDLGRLIEEVIDILQPLSTKTDVALHYPRTAAKPHVAADQQRLKQVLLNIMANGVKYNRPGGRVDVAVEKRPDGKIRILVRDTGPGIAPDNIGKLFQPFERLGAEGSEVEGTGLGLALTKRLVEAMQGQIGVESVVGEGSTFWVDLVAAKNPVTIEATSAVELCGSPPPDAGAPRVRILYIEDNPDNLRLVEELVAGRRGVELLSAIQGSIGLELAREHHPDLIFLDLNLPDIDGERVLEALDDDEETRHIPVVVISADVLPSRVERITRKGALRFLPKPLNVPDFFHVLEEAQNHDVPASNRL